MYEIDCIIIELDEYKKSRKFVLDSHQKSKLIEQSKKAQKQPKKSS